jgi:hypothetical protein
MAVVREGKIKLEFTKGKQVSIEKCLNNLAIDQFSKYLSETKGIELYNSLNARQISIIGFGSGLHLDVFMLEPQKKVMLSCFQDGKEKTVEFEIKKVFAVPSEGLRFLHHFWLKSGAKEAEFITDRAMLYTD